MITKATLAAGFCVACIASQASAQSVIVYRPIAPAPVVAAPVVVQRPVFAPVAPSHVTRRPMVTSFRPAPVSAYSRVVPSVSAYSPVTAYAPVVPSVTAYSPVGPNTVAAPVAAPPVIVRPKVYIPGRPLRNLLQAITP